jgi:tRNA nucleotidyltransferase (CCA-adding enzyme)
MKKHNLILKKVLEKISPEKERIRFMEKELRSFLTKVNKNIKKFKINAEIFVGGSFAKKTLIKKKVYDIDLFLRFDKKYPEKEFSSLSKKVLSGIKFTTVHGSRDYFKVDVNSWFCFEIVPVLKVKKYEEAKNITDLSYSHVKYINKKIKSQKILDEIKLAKAFCYGSETYGAESYIQGFSGYALELLVYYYGSFLKMLNALLKQNKEKIIIDIEKHYKKKQNILLDLNGAKLESPIILIDPTYKERNALAALSNETFLKFQKAAKKFLKNPSEKDFEIKKIDLEKIKKNSKGEFILVEFKTSKPEGDVAGSKLLKFYKHLLFEIEKYFEIKKKGFIYEHKQEAKAFFVLNPKKEIIFSGPKKDDKKNVNKFKKKHKRTFAKKSYLYAKEKINFSGREFLKKWKKKNSRKIKEMYIKELKII